MIIVLFHVLYIFGKFVYDKYRQNKQKPSNVFFSSHQWTDPESPDACPDYNDVERDALKFRPPAYVQRYIAVQNVLSDPVYEGKIRKVVDYGCSELGFLNHLKHTPGIEEIICIDIDRRVLDMNVRKAEPLTVEYLNCRPTPLLIEVYEGSITDRDRKLEKTDAVVCIELIEHLYPDTLIDFPFNVFGYIKPKVVVVTTPNADFNVLFPNFSGFRHLDHKFEWTRQQFQDWAENIVLRYPQYKVTFSGICNGPPGTEHLGSCSQMAVFHRVTENDTIPVFGAEGLLKLVASHEYPYRMDNRSDEQKILDEAVYQIRRLSYNDTDTIEEVPLQRLWQLLQRCNVSLESLRTILAEGGWAVEDHEDGPVVLVPPVSTFSDNSIVENEFWNDDNADDDDDGDELGDPWDDEPGPPVDYDPAAAERERTQFFDNWERDNWERDEEDWETNNEDWETNNEDWERNEEWEEEPSIVIPQSNPVDQNNTYLFDGDYSNARQENIFSSTSQEINVNASNDPSNTVILDTTNSQNLQDNTDRMSSSANHVPEYFEENCQIIDLQNISFSPIKQIENIEDSVDSSCNSELVDGSVLSDSIVFSSAISSEAVASNDANADSVTQCTMEQRVKRSLEFQPYISCTRSSTSPEPFLSDSICVNKFPYNDSIVDSENDAMHHSMLNNTFRNFDMSALASEEAQEDKIDAAITPTRFIRECKPTDDTYIDPPYCKSNEICFRSPVNLLRSTATTDDTNPMENLSDHKISNETVPVNDQCIERCNIGETFSLPSIDNPNNHPQYTSSPRVNVKSEKPKDVRTMRKQLRDKFNDVHAKNSSQENSIIDRFKDSTLMHKDRQVDIEKSDRIDRTSKSTVDKTLDVEACAISLDKQDNSVTIEENTINFSIDTSQIKVNSDQCKMMDKIDKDVISTSVENISNLEDCKNDSYVSANEVSDSKLKESCVIAPESTSSVSNNDECAKESSTHTTNADKDYVISVPSSLSKSKTKKIELQSKEVHRDSLEDICSKCESANISEKVEPIEVKENSPEILETPPNSWSPEIMDSGYPNSASAQDITPEYDLSSIAQDRISDAESPSVAEVPRLGFVEVAEVENGDLANNNRDGEGNNMIAVEANELEDLQPLIDVLENDMENENDIYVVENGFPIWLLRILEMANPVDLEAHHDLMVLHAPDLAERQDEGCARLDQDEGFKSSSSENDSDMDENAIEMENNIVDDNDSEHENDNGNENENEIENENNPEFDNEAVIKT